MLFCRFSHPAAFAATSQLRINSSAFVITEIQTSLTRVFLSGRRTESFERFVMQELMSVSRSVRKLDLHRSARDRRHGRALPVIRS